MTAVSPPLVPREVDFISTEELMAMTPMQLRTLVMRSGILESRKGPWSPEESHRLITLVRLMGPQDWVSIASYMASRNAKQCRERYHQNLDPSLRHDPISEDEARHIMDLYAKYGTAWARIAEHLPGRSDNAIKNYVNGLVNKTRRAEERQAGHHASARRRGSGQSTLSGASPSAPVSAVIASSSSPGGMVLTPSSFGSQALESPTFSDMTDSDGINNYTLASTSPWGQSPAAVPHASPAHHPTHYHQQAHEASVFGQNGHGYIHQHDGQRPVSGSSDSWSFLGSASQYASTDLARYSISGPASRELTRDLMMQNHELPRIQPPWAENQMSRTAIMPSPEQSVAVPPGHQVDPRMAIANLLV
ncbi:uncharacterized protein Triagg1_9880 [Trichoderma aggressivum f. europaeum]|uniref:Uncharacterized protein n=1 Tax=Trichoderma aggressivum f. europaeum TaxID=173218 RepID=A0AAE1LWQ4_9HYPO|nr:hypothetical protein Triagg1_9880 [Trichoderma aggressivum f. europaeum]